MSALDVGVPNQPRGQGVVVVTVGLAPLAVIEPAQFFVPIRLGFVGFVCLCLLDVLQPK